MTAGVVRPIGAARDRVLSVALDLFVHHGVNGTTLQMIADSLGVAKATVYHQFQSKSELTLAVIAPAVESMTRVADAAQSCRSVTRKREVALSGVVDLVVQNRRLAAVLNADPIVSQLVEEHHLLRALSDRVRQLLTGPNPDAETVVAVAMVAGGLMMVGMDPALLELDDESLRCHLLSTGRRTLRLRQPRAQV